MSALENPAPRDFARQRDVAAALRAFLPESSVLFSAEDVKPYECDGLSAFRQLPMVVVLPANEEEIQRVLQLCDRMKVPVVPRGAGTGLSGGALPLGDGVLPRPARKKSPAVRHCSPVSCMVCRKNAASATE